MIYEVRIDKEYEIEVLWESNSLTDCYDYIDRVHEDYNYSLYIIDTTI